MKKNVYLLNFRFAKNKKALEISRYLLTVFLLTSIFELSTSFTVLPDTSGETDNDTTGPSLPHVSELYYKNYMRDTILLSGYHLTEVPHYDEKIYTTRLKGIKSTIPLTYNKHVKGYIDLYLYRKRCLASKIIGRSYDYFPLFEEALKRHSLPAELKNLAIVESALNLEARSPAGALGIWQFMPLTGKIYKLKIDSIIDERKDPVRATEAAIYYLKDLHRIYKDWLLAIAAYNCGPGNVNKAIKKARRHGRRADFWSIKPYLPTETQGYVPAFIASCYMMNHYSDHNLRALNPAFLSCEVKPVEIRYGVTFEEISKRLGITPEELTFFNPDFETAQLIPVQDSILTLNLPVILHDEFSMHEEAIYKSSELKVKEFKMAVK
jgi:membrane-bound lytic murein transglycosylase D